MTSTCPTASRDWPLERILFALAGTGSLLSAALVALVSPRYLLLTAFVSVKDRMLPDVRFGHA